MNAVIHGASAATSSVARGPVPRADATMAPETEARLATASVDECSDEVPAWPAPLTVAAV
jgi:hypothetical protein